MTLHNSRKSQSFCLEHLRTLYIEGQKTLSQDFLNLENYYVIMNEQIPKHKIRPEK